jgi:hypothetical protein
MNNAHIILYIKGILNNTCIMFFYQNDQLFVIIRIVFANGDNKE